MAAHPRASSDIQSAAGAAFDDFELDEEAEADGRLDEGEDAGVEVGAVEEDRGAAVEEKESLMLSRAQNFWARFSAVGTFAPQLAATQV